MTTTISPSLARRHEAVAVRLDALLRELAPIARKRPEGRVPPAVAESAARVLTEARPFGAVPVLSPGQSSHDESWAGLIAALVEARARLETFETAHSAWDGHGRAWCTPGGPQPIARLRAAIKPRPGATTPARSNDVRQRLTARIDGMIVTAYQQGFADATEGRPATPHAVTLAARRQT